MSTQPVAEQRSSTGWDEGSAQRWLTSSLREEDVEFPWQLATALVRECRPETRLVLDVASGPGGFLATVLEVFSDAHGVWFDASRTMEEAARANLARFGSRVSYVVGDLTEIAQVGSLGTFDLVMSSRATHHLMVTDLARFYQQAASLLSSDGWLANVDSMSEAGPWRDRLRRVRSQFRRAAQRPEVPSHPQLVVAPSVADHMTCLLAAGFVEAEVVWRVFVSNLVMARKRNPAELMRSERANVSPQGRSQAP